MSFGLSTIYDAGASVFGGIGDAASALGDWSQKNYGGAMILGATIGAAGNYISQKSKEKHEEKQFKRENDRYDELHQVADVKWSDPTMDSGSVAGNAPLTNEGLLTNMQQTNPDNNKNKLAV